MIGTKVGRTKHTRIMPGGALETEQTLASTGPSSTFVGKKLDEHRGSFILEYPMDKGHIVDGGWDAMEALWEVREQKKTKTRQKRSFHGMNRRVVWSDTNLRIAFPER